MYFVYTACPDTNMRLIRYPYVYTQKYSWMQSWRNDNIHYTLCVSAAHAQCTYACISSVVRHPAKMCTYMQTYAILCHFGNCFVQSNSFFSLRPILGITFHGSSQLGAGLQDLAQSLHMDLKNKCCNVQRRHSSQESHKFKSVQMKRSESVQPTSTSCS